MELKSKGWDIITFKLINEEINPKEKVSLWKTMGTFFKIEFLNIKKKVIETKQWMMQIVS